MGEDPRKVIRVCESVVVHVARLRRPEQLWKVGRDGEERNAVRHEPRPPRRVTIRITHEREDPELRRAVAIEVDERRNLKAELLIVALRRIHQRLRSAVAPTDHHAPARRRLWFPGNRVDQPVPIVVEHGGGNAPSAVVAPVASHRSLRNRDRGAREQSQHGA
jgi:hypothetical protein